MTDATPTRSQFSLLRNELVLLVNPNRTPDDRRAIEALTDLLRDKGLPAERLYIQDWQFSDYRLPKFYASASSFSGIEEILAFVDNERDNWQPHWIRRHG